jgi:hypothetical protein
MKMPMKTLYLSIALTAILAMFWAPDMAGDARLLLSPSPDSLGDNGLPEGWQTLRFQNVAKPTDYSVGLDGEGMALKAVSRAPASGIYTEVDMDANEYPLITWNWKVANLIAKGDATTKNGDDFPDRVIVAFHYDPPQASVFKRYLKVENDRSSSTKDVHLAWLPRRCPHVSWRWRISNTTRAGDLMRKEGNDAAAKLYVAFLADTDNTRSRVTAGLDDLTSRCTEPETSRVRR